MIKNQQELAYSSESDLPGREKGKIVMERLKTQESSFDFKAIMKVPKFCQNIVEQEEGSNNLLKLIRASLINFFFNRKNSGHFYSCYR